MAYLDVKSKYAFMEVDCNSRMNPRSVETHCFFFREIAMSTALVLFTVSFARDMFEASLSRLVARFPKWRRIVDVYEDGDYMHDGCRSRTNYDIVKVADDIRDDAGHSAKYMRDWTRAIDDARTPGHVCNLLNDTFDGAGVHVLGIMTHKELRARDLEEKRVRIERVASDFAKQHNVGTSSLMFIQVRSAWNRFNSDESRREMMEGSESPS